MNQQVALITGASRGIGRAVAAELLAGVDLKGRKVRLLGVTLSNSPRQNDGGQLHFDFA